MEKIRNMNKYKRWIIEYVVQIGILAVKNVHVTIGNKASTLRHPQKMWQFQRGKNNYKTSFTSLSRGLRSWLNQTSNTETTILSLSKAKHSYFSFLFGVFKAAKTKTANT